MGQIYNQLSLQERVQIYRWHMSGRSARWIGEALGRHPGTISREIARNSKLTKQWRGNYDPVRAHGLALRRRQWDCRFKLARQPCLRDFVHTKLAMGWSPEAIAGRLARQQSTMRISHEAIYRYVYFRSAQKDYWHRLLPQKKHRRGWLRPQGGSAVNLVKGRVSIAERPSRAADRKEPGHWEVDMMGFRDRRQNLLVAQERTSRFVLIAKPPNRTAAVIVGKLKRWFSSLPPELRLTLTQDNGPEFARHHQLVSDLGLKTYFCDPHSPWQKGSIENMNGRLRRALPRSTNLEACSHAFLSALSKRYNGMPRKCLGFQTAEEVFKGFLKSSHFNRESIPRPSPG
jgi:transposase, IS30 family